MPKRKILHIIKSLGRGGAEMLLPETLNIHDKSKFEFHYIYFLPWKDQMVREIENEGGKVTCFSAKNNIRLLGKVWDIIKYCKLNQIDLIHCHLPWAGFIGRLVFLQTNIPVIYSEHNMQERYHPITKILNKYSFNSQSLAIGVSQDVSNSIRKNIRPKIPVNTILNGVNTKKYIRDEKDNSIRLEYNIPENSIVIGLVSVFRFQKRIKEWLQVFKDFSATNTRVFGIIVGAGPLDEEIRDELKRLKLEGKVVMPGLQENTRPYFNAMDIFMMSSSFEGLPIALLEAMSMKCAIVTTDAGGIKEVIRDEIDGMVVNVENWEDLSLKLKEITENPDLLIKYKTAARKRVINEFSLKTMVENLENEYLKLTNDY